MHVLEGGSHAVKQLLAIVFQGWDWEEKQSMVVKRFWQCACREIMESSVSIMQKKMQNMWMTEDDVDALKWKGWQW